MPVSGLTAGPVVTLLGLNAWSSTSELPLFLFSAFGLAGVPTVHKPAVQAHHDACTSACVSDQQCLWGLQLKTPLKTCETLLTQGCV